MVRLVRKLAVNEVNKLAFGDNGPKKKTAFERLTLVVVIIMLLVTLGAVVLTALNAVGIL